MKVKRKLVVVAVVTLGVIGAGGAIAATGLGTPQEESKAILDDAAAQLGVDSAKLSDALKNAMAKRVDAAVAAGQLTKEEAAAIKERIQADDFPLLGMKPGFGRHERHHVFGAKLDGAAQYLGVTEAELRTELEAGKSLADVAKAKGKSVDGLVQALTAGAKEKLDAAVEAGDLTRAEADEMLADMKEHLTEVVNGLAPKGPRGFGPRLFRSDRGDDAEFAPSVAFGMPA